MPYEVRIEESGRTFTVEEGESVLTAALRQGIQLAHSCRSGVCRTCEGSVLAGEIAYPEGQPAALDADAQGEGRALLCQAMPKTDLVVSARELEDGGPPTQRLPARVHALEDLAHDVRRVVLRLPQGKWLSYRPGQYLDLLLSGQRRRSFSMANAPGAPHSTTDDGAQLLELHIRHVPGGWFTGHVFTELKEGALLRIEAPMGDLYLRDAPERPAVLVAGGTGFGPLKALLEEALAEGSERPFHLYWGARDRPGLYLHEMAMGWAEAYDSVAYTPVLSETVPPEWRGRSGWVHEAVLEDFTSLRGCEVYMAGPPPMVEAAKSAFIGHGLTPERLFYDSFEYSAT